MTRRALIALLLLLPGLALARTHIGIQIPAAIPDTTDAPLSISLNFTDPAPEFSTGSMTLTNATVADFASSGNDRDFSFLLVPQVAGAFGLEIPEGIVGDNNIALQISSVYAPAAPADDATTTPEATSTPPVDDSTPAPAPANGGGGSGNAGGTLVENAIVPPPIGNAAAPAAEPQAAPASEVLGAQAFRFTTFLARGMDGDGVRNLQKVLINLGFLGTEYAIGHFGPRTEAAVRGYQSARGLPQAGVVGPRTRAALNNEDLSALQ